MNKLPKNEFEFRDSKDNLLGRIYFDVSDLYVVRDSPTPLKHVAFGKVNINTLATNLQGLIESPTFERFELRFDDLAIIANVDANQSFELRFNDYKASKTKYFVFYDLSINEVNDFVKFLKRQTKNL